MKLGKKILSAVVAVMMLLSIAPAASAATYDADYCYSEGYDVAVQIGAEGSVLLKNKDNLLPLAEDTKVTVLGAMSYNLRGRRHRLRWRRGRRKHRAHAGRAAGSRPGRE